MSNVSNSNGVNFNLKMILEISHQHYVSNSNGVNFNPILIVDV